MPFFTKNTNRTAIMLCLSYACFAIGATPEQLAEKAKLQKKLASVKVATKQAAIEQRNLISLREQDQSSLEKEIHELEQKKLRLGTTLSAQKSSLAKQVTKLGGLAIKPYDTVTFTSGRTVKCSVVSYEDQQFKLKDLKGNSLHIFPNIVAGAQLRNEVEADLFPSHVVNKGPQKLKNKQPTVSSKPTVKEFVVKDHMVDIKISRSKSKSKIDTRIGYIDEVAEIVQYDCRVESKAIPSDVKGLRLRVWVFAEGVTGRKPLKLILKENKIFDLPRLDEFEFETDSVTLQYDEKGGARYGYKHYGWISLLEDAKGNVINIKQNKTVLEDNLERIKNLSLNEEIQL